MAAPEKLVPVLLGLELEEGGGAPRSGSPLEAGKGKETDSLLSKYFEFSPVKPILDLMISRTLR